MVRRLGAALALALSFLALLLPATPLTAQGGGITPKILAGPLKLRTATLLEPNRAPSSGPYGFVIWIVNTSTSSADIDAVDCIRTGPITCGPPPTNPGGVRPNDSVAVTVSYTTTSATGAGTIGITVTTVSPVDTYTKYRNVSVVPPGKPSVNLFATDVDNIDRGLCLTTGAGEAAGLSCGDLFVVHGMPTYRTLGRDRSLSLYYSSVAATPLLLVPVKVGQPSTIAYPDKYQVKVTVAGVSDSAEFLPSPLCSPCGGYGETQQVVVGRGLDLSGLATGRYPLTVRVRNIYAGSIQDSVVTGSVLLVNRSASEYGRGWALLGVEQLAFDPADTTRLVWLAGDGSIRVYAKSAPGDSVFQGAKGDAPDSLVKYFNPAANNNAGAWWFRRDLKHGAAVSFDETGRHRETRNRVGAVTRFHWSTHSFGVRLDSIVVPPNDLVSRAYRLGWNATTGRLDRITDPTGRVLLATLVGDQVRTLTDDDGQRTRFTYDATGGRLRTRIATRPGAVGDSAITSYTYGNNARVTQVLVQRDSVNTLSLRATTTLTPWDEKGLALAYASQVSARWDTAGLPTRVDGPLPGIGDAADISVDRFGAPKKIVQLGLNATTSFWRDNLTLPALVTQVRYPNGRMVKLSWTARGNLEMTRDSTSHLGADSVPIGITTYTYLTASAPDSPTLVTDSIGGVGRTTRYTYTAQGLTDTVIDPRGHRTSFVYDTGFRATLVRRVTEHQVETWRDIVGVSDTSDTTRDQVHRFDYDANGNLKADTSATGALTTYVSDAAGRVTDIYDPLGLHTHRTYDRMNRLRGDTVYTAKGYQYPVDVVNPFGACDATQMLCADLTRSFVPALPPVLSTVYVYDLGGALVYQDDPRLVIRRFGYDARGLPAWEKDEFAKVRTAAYNAAGQIAQTISRTGKVVTTSYDTAGRVIAVSYPSTTNGAVPGDSIRYTYDIMGNVLTLRNRIGTITRSYFANGLLRSEKAATGNDSVAYAYDATGARIRAARTHDAVTDVTTYTYAPTTGELQSLTVTWGGTTLARTVSFQWDSLGRRRRITYPNGAVVQYRYDAAGLLRRLVSSHTRSDFTFTDNLAFTYRADTVDAAGRILAQRTLCPSTTLRGADSIYSACRSGSISDRRVSLRYNRLGMLGARTDAGILETYEYDASGNLTARRAPGANHRYAIAAGSNRVLRDTLNSSSPDSLTYDANGARWITWTSPTAVKTGYYYDGLERPTAVFDASHHTDPADCMKYDGASRLVQACDGALALLGFDGANIAAAGLFRFVHGPGVDDPLVGLYRPTSGSPVEYFWVTDGQGRQLAVGLTDGTMSGSSPGIYATEGGSYAGGTANAQSFTASRFETPVAPGFSFFRNRIYDQGTGRWTQEDPIGLAGGSNLYQYAGNNPATYTDPFGLCPSSGWLGVACAAIEATASFLGGIAGCIVGCTTGALETAGTGGLALPVGVGQSIAATATGAAIGLAAGKTITAAMFSDNAESPSGGAGEAPKAPTAGEIISQSKKGSINKVFPGEMRGKTLDEITELAKQGNRAAQTARKLLTDSRFDK